MAKIFKISGYFVDPNDNFDAEDIKIFLDESFDVISKHTKVEEVDIGEWEDENPHNYIDSPESECEKYFKE